MNEKDLLRELIILTAKRQVRPSIQDSERMRAIFAQLYEITGDQIYFIK